MSSTVFACFKKRQNISSLNWREMFSNARKWSPGRSGGETSRKYSCTLSPSRLLKSIPSGLTPTVPTSFSTLGCLVCGTATPRADAGAAQLLALHDGADDAFQILFSNFAGSYQSAGELADDALLILGG